MKKFSTNSIARLLVSMVLLNAFAVSARAEIIRGHDLKKTRQALEQRGAGFDATDFLRMCSEVPKQNTFMLGEPVPLRFRIVNHTKRVIVVNVGMDFRSAMEVRIGDGRRPPRRYVGPNPPGDYPPLEMKLYPLEERPFQIMLWGDIDSATGLAFPEPGQYSIDYKIRVKVPDANIEADINPIDPITLAPEKPWIIQVRAPSPEEAPLIDELKAMKAFVDLHARHLPGDDTAKFAALIDKYPATPISPYLTFVLGLHYNFLSLSNKQDTSLMTKSSEYLQMAGLADSAIKADAWEALIYLYDRWGLTQPAQDAILKYMAESPAALRPLIGNMTVVKKYFPNSIEMDQMEYWDLLN